MALERDGIRPRQRAPWPERRSERLERVGTADRGTAEGVERRVELVASGHPGDRKQALRLAHQDAVARGGDDHLVVRGAPFGVRGQQRGGQRRRELAGRARDGLGPTWPDAIACDERDRGKLGRPALPAPARCRERLSGERRAQQGAAARQPGGPGSGLHRIGVADARELREHEQRQRRHDLRAAAREGRRLDARLGRFGRALARGGGGRLGGSDRGGGSDERAHGRLGRAIGQPVAQRRGERGDHQEQALGLGAAARGRRRCAAEQRRRDGAHRFLGQRAGRARAARVGRGRDRPQPLAHDGLGPCREHACDLAAARPARERSRQRLRIGVASRWQAVARRWRRVVLGGLVGRGPLAARRRGDGRRRLQRAQPLHQRGPTRDARDAVGADLQRHHLVELRVDRRVDAGVRERRLDRRLDAHQRSIDVRLRARAPAPAVPAPDRQRAAADADVDSHGLTGTG